MLKHLEKLGEKLAGVDKTQGSQPSPQAHSSPENSSESLYTFFHIKPFKDNDRGINHWDTVSKNLISLKKKKIIFVMSGNNADIKLFV